MSRGYAGFCLFIFVFIDMVTNCSFPKFPYLQIDIHFRWPKGMEATYFVKLGQSIAIPQAKKLIEFR